MPESAPETATPDLGPLPPGSEAVGHHNGTLWAPGNGNIQFNPHIENNATQTVGAESAPATPRSIPVVEGAPEEPQPLEVPAETAASPEDPLEQRISALEEQMAQLQSL